MAGPFQPGNPPIFDRARLPDQAAVVGKGEAYQVGVTGSSTDNVGVYGSSVAGPGVRAIAKSGPGISADSQSGHAVVATSEQGFAVYAINKSNKWSTVGAYNQSLESEAAAIFGKKDGDKGYAGRFEGNVRVTGVLTVDGDVVLSNADCAEDFDIAVPEIDPGSVMVLDDDGRLEPCEAAYDPRVVGVISGAGPYRPAVTLDRRESGFARQPIALLGKVFCKVDATFQAVAAGDLLTTSPTRGHAMKASDQAKAFGCVLGKALASLPAGQGLIPMLVALQ